MPDKRRLFKEVRGEVGCTNEIPTAEELKEALNVEAERLSLQQTIAVAKKRLEEIRQHPSRVFYDEAGFMYDVRTFIASGQIDYV